MPHACQSGRCGTMRNWTEAIWENIQRRGILSAFFLAVNVWIVWLADHVGLRWLHVFQFFTWDEYPSTPPIAHFWGTAARLHGSTTSRLDAVRRLDLICAPSSFARFAVVHLHHSTHPSPLHRNCLDWISSKDSSSLKLNANLIDWRGWALGTRARVHGLQRQTLSLAQVVVYISLMKTSLFGCGGVDQIISTGHKRWIWKVDRRAAAVLRRAPRRRWTARAWCGWSKSFASSCAVPAMLGHITTIPRSTL